MIRSAALSNTDKTAHGFFTREGGVSKGLYAGRNCGLGSDDDRGHVIENRGRIADDLRVDRNHLVTAYQVHSPTAVTVVEPWVPEDAPQADAMVTNVPGIALGILTADCTPVLFADPQAGVIGAAHAGWKGALGGVLESTVTAMEKLGASRASITAAIGPTISQENYEVTDGFMEPFLRLDAANSCFFAKGARPGHRQFDLPGFVHQCLTNLEVGTIDQLGICTYADPERFFSFRRTTHREEPDYGRQISAIALRER